MPDLHAALVRLLHERKPARVLHLLANARVPVLAADRFAARRPAPGLSTLDASPLIAPLPPGPVTPGPLDGDVVIKDQIDVAGAPTGVGLAHAGEPATADAAIVARIRAAGGRIVGKAKMTELGIDGIGSVMHYDMPSNPVAPGYAPGGSSTGTAVAVAAGLARYGVGGDGLGSIRIPAAFCGLVGLKPSREAIPRAGIRAPVRTLDAVGPIARTVADTAALWQVMAGLPVEPLAPWVPPRLGVPLARMQPARDVARAFTRVLTRLGAARVDLVLPGMENATFLGGLIGAHEAATGPFAGKASSRAGLLSYALGSAITPDLAARLYAQRDALRAATAAALERTPVLAFPTTAIPPPALTRGLVDRGAELLLLRALGAYTPLANLTDLPAIAVPCGVDDRGRPLSVMFVTTRGGEVSLLRLALAVERLGLATTPV